MRAHKKRLLPLFDYFRFYKRLLPLLVLRSRCNISAKFGSVRCNTDLTVVMSCCVYDCTVVTDRVKNCFVRTKERFSEYLCLVVAPEMQYYYGHLKPISDPFFILLPTKGGVAGDVAQRDARARTYFF